MKIEISLDTKDAADLAALMALVGSLGTGGVERPTRAAPTVVHLSADEVLGISAATPIDAPVFPDRDGNETEADDASDSLPNPEGAPDVDSRGLPWDERIHASTKATNGDGTWRNKRGVDKDVLATVEAELAAVPNAPTVEPAATASGAADVAGVSDPAPSAAAGEIPNPPAPVAEASATTIPEAPASPSAGAPTFKDAMSIVTTRQREGTLTQVQVSEAAQALGLSSVVDLAKPANADQIEAFIALLG